MIWLNDFDLTLRRIYHSQYALLYLITLHQGIVVKQFVLFLRIKQ